MSYPGNLSVSYSYDGVGNVSQVTLNRNGQNTTLLSNMVYEPFGPLKGFSRGNGLNTSLGYDQAYRLTAVNDPVYDADISYDANGNITYQTRTTGNLDTGYDALDKLISASDPGGTSGYQYDRNGNRTRLTENLTAITYGYQPQSNRLASIDGQPVTLDANGNTTQLRGMALTYSPDNRLISATNQGSVTRYGYNASGERVIKISADNHKTVYNYGPQGQLLAELDGSGQVEKAYIHANSQPIAVVDYSTAANGELYYIHSDHLGTPQALTDENGTVVWKASYQPFGLAAADVDPDQDGVNIEFNLRFPGQYFDEESGLHYNYFRDYDPQVGRYIESDPIGLNGGLNTYAYVGGNPTKYIDLFGLDQMNRSRSAPGGGRGGRNYDSFNILIGSTILTPTSRGVRSAQTTGIGIGVYAQICNRPVEDPCDSGKPDLKPDAASTTFRYLIGVGFGTNGACLSIGPVMSFPGIEFDTTGVF